MTIEIITLYMLIIKTSYLCKELQNRSVLGTRREIHQRDNRKVGQHVKFVI